MADKTKYSATSESGDFAQALQGAVTAAARALNTNFFAWRLDSVAGTVGGFMGAHDVTVAIETNKVPKENMLHAAVDASGSCGDWHAWHNRMPGTQPTLHVIGRCIFPTSGYRVELKPLSPQGVNPTIYLLEKVVHAPSGPVTQVETEVPIHYTEPTSAAYATVHILPDNVVVEVLEVS